MSAKTRKGRSKRLSDYVRPQLRPFSNGPEGSVEATADTYVITTPLGTKIAFDMCGRCGVHVKVCRCTTGPSMPRSVEYIWDTDTALSNGEEWDHNHKNYRGSFARREAKKNLRMPTFEKNEARIYTVTNIKKKRLSVYIELAQRRHDKGVKRLLRGRKR